MYLTGGSAAYVNSDVAENLLTEAGRNSVLCEERDGCTVKEYTRELEHGDVICINPKTPQTILKCTEANSRHAIGVISNTSIIQMGNNGKYGYPVAVAGVVWVKATNENGDINLGDWLVSSSKSGYAMKNNEPKAGTVLGKAFDFCDEEECRVLMFVAH
jgi:hypothetical protein